MSQENVEIVRQPIAVRAQSRRRLEERLGLRFPRALSFLARMVWQLPPRSRLRQAIIRRAVRLGTEATNRGDYEATFTLFHPDIELIPAPEQVGLGQDPLYRGRAERLRFQRRWSAEWGEFQFEPEEIVDLGSRLLLVGRIEASGLSSGAAVDSEWATLFTISAGRVIREQPFFDRAKALQAAGLRE
jgi:ketosteroid isomerase-like protein